MSGRGCPLTARRPGQGLSWDSALYKLEHLDGSWLADQFANPEVRYPEVHLVFADFRRYAED